MIKSFRNRRTERLAHNEWVREFEQIAVTARKRLAQLDAATSLAELAAIRGNRFEALRKDRAGQYSIRINDQWRICFIWNVAERCAEQVEIVDYH